MKKVSIGNGSFVDIPDVETFLANPDNINIHYDGKVHKCKIEILGDCFICVPIDKVLEDKEND